MDKQAREALIKDPRRPILNQCFPKLKGTGCNER